MRFYQCIFVTIKILQIDKWWNLLSSTLFNRLMGPCPLRPQRRMFVFLVQFIPIRYIFLVIESYTYLGV